MKRDEILKQIRTQCTQQYLTIDNWVHDIHHIKRVVANGRKLSRMENLKPKTAFLVELSCWLHDLGRVGEEIGLLFEQSNHAERSYEMSKQLLKPYERFIGRESMYLLLQAVREHNLPKLKHHDNIVAQLLQDADRGAGLNLIGVYTMLVYLKVVDFKPIETIKEAKASLAQLTHLLVEKGKVGEAIECLGLYHDWYFGTTHQQATGKSVSSLHSKSAKKLFKKGFNDIEAYNLQLQRLQDKNNASYNVL